MGVEERGALEDKAQKDFSRIRLFTGRSHLFSFLISREPITRSDAAAVVVVVVGGRHTNTPTLSQL